MTRPLPAILIALCMLTISYTVLISESPTFVSPTEQINSDTRFSGGDGSAGNPYLISNVTELQWMGNASNLDKHFKLINNINASVTKTWNSGAGFVPIGSNSTSFSGSLDGNNCTISGLYINRPASWYVGLFHTVDTANSVKYLGLIEPDVRGNTNIGGLAGRYEGNINDCYIENGRSFGVPGVGVGGLIGIYLYGDMYRCHSSGSVLSSDQGSGGLLGFSIEGSIYDSYSTCDVDGDLYAGGLVGGLSTATVTYYVSNCYATGNITGNDTIGGLIGLDYGFQIKDSYATGNVSGGKKVGGLLGDTDENVVNSYATGTVTGQDWVGGLIGFLNGGTTSDSYASGDVDGINFTGGLIGIAYTAVSGCHALGNVSGVLRIGGLVGESRESITNSYYKGVVDGVTNVGGLVGYQTGPVTYSYCLGNVEGENNVGGLVGYQSDHVSMSYSRGDIVGDVSVGGFVGYKASGNWQTTRSYSSSNVFGQSNVGGFIGSQNGGLTEDVYCHGSVTRVSGTDPNIGSFVGINNDGKIKHSYTIDTVTFTGFADPANNAFAGSVVDSGNYEMTSCLFDINRTGQISSAGNTSGKYTKLMQMESTFLNEGWDLQTVWTIIDNHTYPHFRFVDNPPFATDDLYTTGERQVLTVPSQGVLVNDFVFGVGRTLTITGYDPTSVLGAAVILNTDGSFTYDATDIPEVLALDDLEWLHDSFNYTITDGAIAWDTGTVHISINGTNLPPSAQNADHSTDEDSLLTIPAPGLLDNTSDLDGDQVTVIPASFTSASGAMVTMNSDGSFSYDPRPSEVMQGLTTGQFLFDTFNYSVSDGHYGLFTAQIWINVSGINDLPEITTSNQKKAFEDVLYNIQYSAEDPDHSSFTWSLESDAGWLSIDVDAGVLSGTPVQEDVGEYWVNVSVLDGSGGFDWSNYTLVVNNTNDAPVWVVTPQSQNITEGVQYTHKFEAFDQDGDDITYVLDSDPASGITLDTVDLTLEWDSPVIGTYDLTMSADDGIAKIVYDFVLSVVQAPDEPEPNQTEPNQTEPGPNATTDTDGDGMPDWWEEFYGFDPEDATDAAGDPDGDNITNLQEFKDKTSPLKDDTIPAVTDDDDDDDDVEPDDDIKPDDDVEPDDDIEPDDDDDDDQKSASVLPWLLVAVFAVIALIFIVLFFLKKPKADELPMEEDDLEDDEIDEEPDIKENDMDEDPEDLEEDDLEDEPEDLEEDDLEDESDDEPEENEDPDIDDDLGDELDEEEFEEKD